jgi:hypothetical protein|tara:strand:+ start:110 stop:361 length:252 start_codon:yes stop_codon:yes gene_type:complete
MQFGQELAYLFVSTLSLAGIIYASLVIGFSWVPILAFVLGYLMAFDPSFLHPNIIGGLTWSLIASWVLLWWKRRKNKKENDEE